MSESQNLNGLLAALITLRYRMVAVLRLLVLRRRKLEVVTDIKKQEIQRTCTNCQIVHRHLISLCGAFAVCASALLRNQHLFFHFGPDVPPQAILSSLFSGAFTNLLYDAGGHHR